MVDIAARSPRKLGAVLAVLAALWTAPALAEPVPGLVSTDQYEKSLREAHQQRVDVQNAIERVARDLPDPYSEAELKQALTPNMILRGAFDYRLEDGTTVRFPWYRVGFANNELANNEAGNPDRTARETNKGGLRFHWGVHFDEVYALAARMDTKLAVGGDSLPPPSRGLRGIWTKIRELVTGSRPSDAIRGAKGGVGAGEVIAVGDRYRGKLTEGDRIAPSSPLFDGPTMIDKLAKAYVEAGGAVGLAHDVQAGDMNTNHLMAALRESYEQLGQPEAGVSGKPPREIDGRRDPSGGIGYRAISTGEGVWMAAKLALERESKRAGRFETSIWQRALGAIGLRREPDVAKGATVVAQGWGAVGRAFGEAARRDGALVIGIQELWTLGGKKTPGLLRFPDEAPRTPEMVNKWLDAATALRERSDKTRERGLPSEEIGEAKVQLGDRTYRLADYFIAGQDASEIKADIVGVNAIGNVLTEKTVPVYADTGTHRGLRKVIVEGANLAETEKGTRLIDARTDKLIVVPGDLANRGGVTMSDIELAMNAYKRPISDTVARAALEKMMRQDWKRGMKIADREGLSERKAIERMGAEGMLRRALGRKTQRRNLAQFVTGVRGALLRGQVKAHEVMGSVRRFVRERAPEARRRETAPAR